jgi:hypothetical protein
MLWPFLRRRARRLPCNRIAIGRRPCAENSESDKDFDGANTSHR